MLIKYRPIIRKSEVEELVDVEIIDGEKCLMVLKSWPTFAEAKAHELKEVEPVEGIPLAMSKGYLEYETSITEEDVQAFLDRKVEEKKQAAVDKEASEARQFLVDTDYVALKIAEGEATIEDYKEILDKRREARKLL